MDAAVEALGARLGPDVVSVDGESLEQAVGATAARARLADRASPNRAPAAWRRRGSPTWPAAPTTSIAASSSTATTPRRDLLGVPAALVAEHGAVSEPVARAMAEGLLARSRAQVAVAITGIAGPGGGTDEKPVGMVWIAVALADPRETRAVVCRFLGGREMVKTFAAITALDLVRRRLIDAPWDVDWIRR